VGQVAELGTSNTCFFYHDAVFFKTKPACGDLSGEKEIAKGMKQPILVQTGACINECFLHLVLDSFNNVLETQYIVFSNKDKQKTSQDVALRAPVRLIVPAEVGRKGGRCRKQDRVRKTFTFT